MQTLLRDFGQTLDVVIPVRAQRYIIASRVWFNWQTTDGRWLEGEGITRDISEDGLFVLTDTVPTVGAPIVVLVEMPALKMLPRPITYRGSGKVVRTEREVGKLCGFAAAVTFDDTDNQCSGDEARLDEELFMRWALLQDGWQPGNPTNSLPQ